MLASLTSCIKIKKKSPINPIFSNPEVRNFMRLWLPRKSNNTAIRGDILFSLSFESLNVVEYLAWQNFLDQSSVPNHHFQKVIEPHQILYQMCVVLADCVVKNLKTPWSEYHYTRVVASVHVLAENLVRWQSGQRLYRHCSNHCQVASDDHVQVNIKNPGIGLIVFRIKNVYFRPPSLPLMLQLNHFNVGV